MTSLSGKNVLVTGGGGFIGSALVERLLEETPATIRVLDHDQHRITALQRRLTHPDVTLQYVPGDVRDPNRVSTAVDGIDVVFHTAAVKHVELSERHPAEAVRTNVDGTRNLLRAAVDEGIDSFVAASTDKASTANCVMGATKRIMEQLVIAANDARTRRSRFNCVRFGNVIGSPGSVVPIFLEQIGSGGPITVTDPEMTRFTMPVERTIEVVLAAHAHGARGRVFVPKMPAFRVGDLAEGLRSAYAPEYGYDPQDIEIDHVGPRPGERTHEKLVSRDEVDRVEELDDLFVIHPDIDVGGEPGTGRTTDALEDEYVSAGARLVPPDELVTMVDRTRVVSERLTVEALRGGRSV